MTLCFYVYVWEILMEDKTQDILRNCGKFPSVPLLLSEILHPARGDVVHLRCMSCGLARTECSTVHTKVGGHSQRDQMCGKH